MKWISVSNQRSTLQEYRLMENDECKVIMKYNPQHSSARISCANQHRLFFIESAGSLTGKYIFKNEYGMEIGNMNHDKWFGKDGSVTIESTKYAYAINNDSPGEVTIYKGTAQQPLAHCGSSVENPGSGINSNCMLLGLCWYLSLNVAKENLVEHAA